MLVFASEIHDLGNFRFGDFIGVNSAFAYAMIMDKQHNSRRLFDRLIKILAQHDYNELLRRIIVIEQ